MFINMPVAISIEDREEAVFDMNNNMYKDTHPDDVARIADAAYRFATREEAYEVIYRTKRKDGSYTLVHAKGEHTYTEDGVRLAQIWYTDEGTYLDDSTTDARVMNRKLSDTLGRLNSFRNIQYDPLTGLPNMNYFFELANERKDALIKSGAHPMMLYFDLKGMRFYNTKYSFAQGDRMLQEFASLIKEDFGEENCCRIGSDHFALITEEEGLEGKLDDLFEKWQKQCNEIPIHAGIYRSKGESIHISIALDRAKLACDALRDDYSSSYRYYSQELSDEVSHKQYIIENLDKAIKENWIQAYMQPIVRAVNGKVCDVEALARWIDPEKGFLSPADFIPALEEAGLIYKLDLHMLDKCLEAMRVQESEGMFVVPHSINLSRSDFDALDIVEEVRKKVDASGFSRDRITIEVTESTIGRDFDFMKLQIERFRELGFPVWMDDFGSGYSSLDVLQSIRFDLIKFDMSFMKKLDQGEEGKIVLTELMRMATALGVDTVCEGVETKSQVDFLKEIGCSKLQGYYFSKPIPYEEISRMNRDDTLIRSEDPRESSYYEMIGRVNLFDIGVVGSSDDYILQSTFSSVPIAILEVTGTEVRYIRANRSYKDFAQRYLNLDIFQWVGDVDHPSEKYDPAFIGSVRTCCDSEEPNFFNETMADGPLVHSFMRRIDVNPKTDAVAIVVAILSVSQPGESATFADIASSLASDYYNIYLIDLDTNNYIEYVSDVGDEKMSLKRHGGDFFESARRDTMTRIFESDREHFLNIFTKENVLDEIAKQGVFTTTYRLIDSGSPVYVNMKINKMKGGNRLILGVSVVDTHMKALEEERRLRQEKASLSRIASLSPNYIVLYIVDPINNNYTQYNPSSEFERLGLASHGDDFFKDVKLDAPKAFAPEDLERHLQTMTKENVMSQIKKNGIFIYNYRFILGGKLIPATLRASLIEEGDGKKLIIGVTNDEEEYNRRLEDAYRKASDDVIIYNHIAHALARDFTEIYYVNMETDEFIAFHTNDENGVLSEARRGTAFFERIKEEVDLYIYPDDKQLYLKTLDRDFLNRTFDRTKEYEITYRRIDRGDPYYAQMKISRMEDDERFIVLALSDVDELMRQRKAEEKLEEERIVYARLHALTGNFIVVYVVDPITDDYYEFSATDAYEENMSQAKEGKDFFNKVRKVARDVNYPKDLELFLTAFTKENIFEEIRRNGSFTLGYRFMMAGKPIHVQMKAAMVQEKEGPRLIVGLNNIDSQVRQEEEFGKNLAKAQSQASIDALTGVKNKFAFTHVQEQFDGRIKDNTQADFAVVMLDLNDLKVINDTEGHKAGDQYLKDACQIICHVFAHSPVFRVGGDEFVAICQGHDYEHIDELIAQIDEHNREAVSNGGIVIACGMSRFRNDDSLMDVYERADQNMYINKDSLKALQKH